MKQSTEHRIVNGMWTFAGNAIHSSTSILLCQTIRYDTMRYVYLGCVLCRAVCVWSREKMENFVYEIRNRHLQQKRKLSQNENRKTAPQCWRPSFSYIGICVCVLKAKHNIKWNEFIRRCCWYDAVVQSMVLLNCSCCNYLNALRKSFAEAQQSNKIK